jgi:hypothetical protein
VCVTERGKERERERAKGVRDGDGHRERIRDKTLCEQDIVFWILRENVQVRIFKTI